MLRVDSYEDFEGKYLFLKSRVYLSGKCKNNPGFSGTENMLKTLSFWHPIEYAMLGMAQLYYRTPCTTVIYSIHIINDILSYIRRDVII